MANGDRFQTSTLFGGSSRASTASATYHARVDPLDLRLTLLVTVGDTLATARKAVDNMAQRSGNPAPGVFADLMYCLDAAREARANLDGSAAVADSGSARGPASPGAASAA